MLDREVEVIHSRSNEAAIEHTLKLYEKRKRKFAGIELRDGSRLMHRFQRLRGGRCAAMLEELTPTARVASR